MSGVLSITSAAVPWVLGVFGVPPLVAEGFGVLAESAGAAVGAGKATAARNKELQAFVAKAVESFDEQCGREIAHLGDDDREAVEKRLRELLRLADRDVMLGAALIGHDEFQLRLFGSEAFSGLDDDGRGYLVALCVHVHGLVLSFAQSDAVLGVASTTAIRIIWRELASRPTLDQVQLLIRQAISGEVEKRRPIVWSQYRPQVAAEFVARDEMPKLREALEQSGVATVSAVHGMRGAGKSQLASAYAQACENDLWRFVGWIPAQSGAEAISKLSEAAQATGISDEDIPEKAAGQLLAWLSSAGPEPRLLVFDNVNSADHIRGLIPTGPGMRVIVTTTRQATALGTPVEIGVYTRQQAIDYLQDATGIRDEDGAAAVAEDLGRLPVALTQAAGVIEGRNYDFVRYRKLLSSGRRIDKAVKAEEGAYPHLVGEALHLAYTDVLRRLDTDVSDVAARVLGALSLLAESGVPREWFRGLADDEFVADDAVGALVENSILIESEDRRIVSLHRLQSQVIREDHEEAKDVEISIAAACTVLDKAVDSPLEGHMAEREANREIAAQLVVVREQKHSRLLLDDERWLRIAGQIIYRSNHLQDPYPAIDLAGYLNEYQRVLGPDHPDTLSSRNNLAGAYESAGDLGRAIPLFEATLQDRERVLGADHPDTLTSRNNLAGAYLSGGDLGRAIPLYEQTRKDYEWVLGADHPDTLMSRNNLAYAYESAGDLGRAIPLYEATLQDRERVLGADHPDTLMSRNNLAYAYESAGDLGRAIPLYEATLQDCVRVLGADHPSALTSRNNLAYAYESAGDLGRAIPLYEQTLEDRKRMLGPDHPSTLTSRNNLAYAYESAGDLGRAIPLYEATLQDCERVLGADHPDTLGSRNNLASAYWVEGRRAEALVMLEESAEAAERLFGSDHVATRQLVENRNVARRMREESGPRSRSVDRGVVLVVAVLAVLLLLVWLL